MCNIRKTLELGKAIGYDILKDNNAVGFVITDIINKDNDYEVNMLLTV